MNYVSIVNRPTKVILHCAATPDFKEHDKRFDIVGVDEIREWHLDRGFQDVGYHYVIRRSGVVEVGRKITIIGAHCYGQNRDSIGVCWVGTFYPTRTQIQELINLYRLFKANYDIHHYDWYGHYEFNTKKRCPGFSIELLRKIFVHY